MDIQLNVIEDRYIETKHLLTSEILFVENRIDRNWESDEERKFVESVRNYGVLKEISSSLMTPEEQLATGCKYWGIKGRRRYHACKTLGIPTIRSKIYGVIESSIREYYDFITDEKRLPKTFNERVEFIGKYVREYGLPKDKVEADLGYSIQKYLNSYDMKRPKTLEKVEHGKLTEGQAKELGRLSKGLKKIGRTEKQIEKIVDAKEMPNI